MGSGQTVSVSVTLSGDTQAMLDAGVDITYMESNAKSGTSEVALKWQLRWPPPNAQTLNPKPS